MILPDVTPIAVAWLAAATTATIAGRVSTSEAPDDGYPQLVLVGSAGAPDTTAQGLHAAGTYPLTLWAVAGRRAGMDDLPDDATAWAAAQAVVEACEAISTAPYVHTDGARIVDALPVSVVPSTATPRGTARVVITLALRIQV